MDADDRPEQLLGQERRSKIVRLDQGGMDEEAEFPAVRTARHQLAACARARASDGAGMAIPRALIDHRTHEVAEVGDVSYADIRHFVGKSGLQGRPETGRHEDPRGRRAFLPLVFETAADDGRRQRLQIATRMGHQEVLAAGLADDARIAAIASRHAVHLRQNVLEDFRRSGEMHTGEPR
jgi:hypothetical protein